MKTKLTLTQQAYQIVGNYTASAIDAVGNEYSVFWSILSNWDRDDEQSACDWDNPAKIERDGYGIVNVNDYIVNVNDYIINVTITSF